VSPLRSVSVLAFVLPLLFAARPAGAGPGLPAPLPPSAEEILDAQVDPDVAYRVTVSSPVPVVPSAGLPGDLALHQSNNNLSIALHHRRLFLAFRTAPTHFASAGARLLVLSSADLGGSWTREAEIATGRDLREPFLLEVNGRLQLYFVELGVHPWAFEPQALWRSARCGDRCWTTPEKWGGPEEVSWDFKVRGGRAWMTSYLGKHYALRTRAIETHFRSSADGVDWRDVGGASVHSGGSTEASFEFDRAGALWAVTRNEDGDASGFGSQVVTAPPDRPGAWQFPARSNPSRLDSPRLFRHGRDIYLVARRDLGPPAGARFESAPGGLRKLLIWASYSLQPKRTALFRLDPFVRRFERVVDLPSAGDTAFPSIVRLSPHEFLVANYSSGFRYPDRSWIWGQLNGTGIYFVRLRFDPMQPPATGGTVATTRSPMTREGAVAASVTPAFDEDWPGQEYLPRRLTALGVLSLSAVVVVRRRRAPSEARRRQRPSKLPKPPPPSA